LSAFNEILDIRAGSPPSPGEVTISGNDPVLPTSFRIGETAAAAIAGVGLAISDLWELKTGRRQSCKVDVRHAAAALCSNKYVRIKQQNGSFISMVDERHEAMRRLTQAYQSKDGRWVLPHFGLSHLQKRVLSLLDAEPNTHSIAKAVSKWDALDLEMAIDEARACGGMVRSNSQWLSEPHGQLLAQKPVVEIIKIGDSDPEPLPKGERPIDGIRVLDLTRILAGPVTARTLAEHGADVLMVAAQNLPQVGPYVVDTSHGKRSCFLDLKNKEESQKLRHLMKSADVFSQGYRPAVMSGLGFGPEEASEIRPGIIYVSISCFGADGPLSHRAGWEQIAQIMTGIAAAGAEKKGVEQPKVLPAAANDYITGYLGAYGTLLALARRAIQGGSYHVRVSLCQSGMMIYRQGQLKNYRSDVGLNETELKELWLETETHLGPIRHFRPVLQLSETTPFWELPTAKLGLSPPNWAT